MQQAHIGNDAAGHTHFIKVKKLEVLKWLQNNLLLHCKPKML